MRFPWDRYESEMQREFAHHMNQLTEEYVRQGHSPEEARRLARREFGGGEQLKEQCRDGSRRAWATGLWQDLVFGVRMMKRAPVVTVAALLTLALGIGATTAMVSLMDVVMWKQLPLPDPGQLTIVNWQSQQYPRDLADSSAGSCEKVGGLTVCDHFPRSAFENMRRSLAGKAELAGFTFPDTVSVSYHGRPAVTRQRPVSGNFLHTLGARTAMGRLLSDSEDDRAAAATAVVSYQFWVQALVSDRGVIGQTMRVNDRPHVIVGVLEPGFYGLTPGDSTGIYTPLQHGAWLQEAHRGSRPLDDERFWCVALIARRAAGVSESTIRAVLDTAFRASWTAQPKTAQKTPQISLEDGSRGLGSLRSAFQRPLLVLGGLVGLLLVIACTNIANLLLARAAARRKEVAMRVSLGCGRGRLMRQFLTESSLLAGLGGASAVGVAYATANLLGGFLALRDDAAVAVPLDLRLLSVIGLITAAALALFGVFPAWRGSRLPAVDALREGRGSMGSVARGWWRAERTLVLGQMALSIVLVVAAIVFSRNLLGITSADPGFDRRNMVLFNVRPGASGYDKARLPSFYFQLEQRLTSTPGVASVGLASMRPMNIGGWWERVQLVDGSQATDTGVNSVTPEYLPLYTPQLMAGRGIAWTDVKSEARVAVISEDLARKLGGPQVLGRMFRFTDNGPGEAERSFEIVGIAPSMAATSMTARPNFVWLPFESTRVEATVVVRTTAPPTAVLAAIRQAMAEIDRNLPMVDVSTMEEQISKGLQRERMFATLCGGLGVLALVLSVVGLYGVISYGTTRRRGEIGLRLALGARPRDVLSMVMREGVVMAALGMAAGAPMVWLGSKYLEKELYQMKPLEPASLLMAVVILGTAALAAVAIPAARAASVAPVEALRQE